MTYRLPTRTTTTCSSSGCASAASFDEGDPATRALAFAGWSFGPESAVCPAHPPQASVLRPAAG